MSTYKMKLTFLFLVLVTTFYAQDTLKISYNSVIEMAVENQPAINSLLEQINLIDVKKEQQNSFNYPHVDATLEYTRIGPVPKLGFPGMGTFQLYPENNYNAKLNLFYNLYDFNNNQNVIDLIESHKLSIRDRIDLIKQNLTYRGVKTFYSLIYLQKVIKVSEEEIKNLEEHLADVNKRIDNGTATDYDALSTKVRITSAQSRLNDTKKAFENYKIGLKNLLNIPHDQALQVDGELTDQELHNTAALLVEQGYQNRPEIKAIRSEMKSVEFQKEAANSSNLPKINLFANYGFKNGFVPNLDVLRGNFVAGINAEIPIFDGFLTENKIAETETMIRIKSDDISNLKRKIKNEIETAYSDMNNDIQKKSLAETQLDAANQALTKAHIQYQTGSVTNLDILDAQTNLSNAKLQYQQVLYQIELDYYNLLEASGIELM